MPAYTFLAKLGNRRAHSRKRSVQHPVRLDPSYGGPHTFGTETVTAQPGDRTVVYEIDTYPVDALPDCRADRPTAYRRYL